MIKFIRIFDIVIAACLYSLIPTYGWSPPVGALLASVATAVGISTAAMTTVAVQMAVSWSLSQVSNYLRKRSMSKAQRDGGITTNRKRTGGANSRTIMLGRYATAGSEVCPPMSRGSTSKTPNIFLTYVVALADTRIEKINRISINGEYVPILATTDDKYGNHLGGKYAAGAVGDDQYAFLRYYKGDQTTADAQLVALFGDYPDRPWTSDMVGKGMAYAIFTVRYNTDLFKGEPEVKYEVDGAHLYDPRKDSSVGGSGTQRWNNPATWAFTRNPMVMVYNLYRGIPLGDGRFYGVGLEAADLPLARSWIAAMNVCDETVDGEPRYQAGLEILVDTDEPADIIDDLLTACDGQVAEVGGVVSARAGGPGLPVAFFEDGDFLTNRDQDFDPFPAMNQTHNMINAVYPHPDEMWQPHDAPAVFRQADIDRDGEERAMSLSLNAVSNPKQAQRIQWAMLKDDQRHRIHNGSLGPYALILEPLDVFSWTSQRNQYVSKLFDITSVTENLNNLCGGYAFREVDPNDYSPEPVLLPDPVAAGGWQLPAKQAVPGFGVEVMSLLDKTGKNRRPVARVYWDPEAAQDVEALRIVIEHVQSGREVAQKTVTRPGRVGFVDISEGLLPEENYRASAIFVVDRPVQWSSWWPFTTLPATLVVVTEDDFSEELRESIANDMREVAEKVGIKPVDELPATGEPNQIVVKIPENRLYRWDVNANGGAGGWSEELYAGIPDGYLDETKFAQSIEPNKIIPAGDPLPTVKSTNNIVWNGALYTWNGTQYTTPSFSLTPGIVKTIHIDDTAVTANKLLNSAVTAIKLASNSVTREKILNDAVSDLKIASQAVTDAKILGMSASKVSGQLTDTQIAGLSAAKLAGQITTTQITDNAISTGKIAAGAVTANEIFGSAVTADKIAGNAVTAGKIFAGAVETAKLATGAVTALKIDSGAVTTEKLFADAVTAGKIMADAVTADKIMAGSVGADKIASRAVIASKVAITDFENLVLDDQFEDPSSWVLDSGVSINTPSSSLNATAPKVLQFDNVTVATSASFGGPTNATSVKPGEELAIGCRVRASGTAGLKFTAYCRIDFLNKDGGSVQNLVKNFASHSLTGFADRSDVAVVPPGAVKAFFLFGRRGDFAGEQNAGYIELPYVRKKNGGELIVGGAITTDKLFAKAVSAGKIDTNAVTTDTLDANAITAGKLNSNIIEARHISTDAITAAKIKAGAVGADQIAARAIVASKLAISDYTNLVPDSEFQDVQAWQNVVKDGTGVFQLRATGSNSAVKTEGDMVYWTSRNSAELDRDFRSELIPVSGGDVLHVAGQMFRSGGTRMKGFIGGIWYEKDKVTSFGFPQIYAVDGTSTTAVRSGELVVPSNAYFFRYRGYVYGTTAETDSNVVFGSPTVRFKNKGELIVDGAITANKLDADSVTANAIKAGAVSATAIAAGAVTASKIDVDTLSAISANMGTITAGTIRSGTSGERFQLDTTNGLRIWGPDGSLRIILGKIS